MAPFSTQREGISDDVDASKNRDVNRPESPCTEGASVHN